MAIITNPVFVSVLVMMGLCVLHVNVYLAIIIAALLCGLMGGAGLVDIITLFAGGMAGHGENAINFTLLAAVAAASRRMTAPRPCCVWPLFQQKKNGKTDMAPRRYGCGAFCRDSFAFLTGKSEKTLEKKLHFR